jgi:hypothetical protein
MKKDPETTPLTAGGEKLDDILSKDKHLQEQKILSNYQRIM